VSEWIATLETQRAALVDAMVAPLRRASVGDEVLATYLLEDVARQLRGETPLARPPVRVSDADVPRLLRTALVSRLATHGAGVAAPLDAAVTAVLTQLRWSAADASSSPAPIAECDVAIAERIATLELIDPLTADHSRAVAAWSRRIAERLGLARDESLHASRSGLIHDIGKSAVPLALLVAPRALESGERAQIEEHVVLGERMVNEQPVLRPFAPAVRHHHERYDGRGYPDGLRGEAIPLVTRIVSVADAFNAMIDRRPYRAPRSPAAALLELVHERGRQFDPAIVDAMILVVEDGD
jgi:HD-GYP domain-containing protein (c-di-GMP phosphodiesterase class II)